MTIVVLCVIRPPSGAERVVRQITDGSRASLPRTRLRPAAGIEPESLPDVRLAVD